MRSRIVVTEEDIDEDIIIKRTFKRRERLYVDPRCWEPVLTTQDTPIKIEKFKKRSWGPISWYEKIK